MKLFTYSFFFLSFFIGLECYSENVYLRVKSGKSERNSKNMYKSTYSSKKKYSESQGIHIKIRNNNRESRVYAVEWYFVARPLDNDKDRWIYDAGSRELPLKPSQTEEFSVESKLIEGTDYENDYYHTDIEEGGTYDSFAVVVRLDDKMAYELTKPTLR